MHSIGASIYLEVELENALEETSVIQLELEKEFGGTGPHLEMELEKVFQLGHYNKIISFPLQIMNNIINEEG